MPLRRILDAKTWVSARPEQGLGRPGLEWMLSCDLGTDLVVIDLVFPRRRLTKVLVHNICFQHKHSHCMN
jgi:hypothetical protein